MRTSEERREVAAMLMQMANAHDATEASRVAHAIGLEYKIYGTVVAFDSADIRNLADLIDPTCEVEGSIFDDTCECESPAWGHHLSCGHWIDWGDSEPPRYCPYCGCRIVGGRADA